MAIHVALLAWLVALLTSPTISCSTSLCRYPAGTSVTEAHHAPAVQLSGLETHYSLNSIILVRLCSGVFEGLRYWLSTLKMQVKNCEQNALW